METKLYMLIYTIVFSLCAVPKYSSRPIATPTPGVIGTSNCLWPWEASCAPAIGVDPSNRSMIRVDLTTKPRFLLYDPLGYRDEVIGAVLLVSTDHIRIRFR